LLKHGPVGPLEVAFEGAFFVALSGVGLIVAVVGLPQAFEQRAQRPNLFGLALDDPVRHGLDRVDRHVGGGFRQMESFQAPERSERGRGVREEFLPERIDLVFRAFDQFRRRVRDAGEPTTFLQLAASEVQLTRLGDALLEELRQPLLALLESFDRGVELLLEIDRLLEALPIHLGRGIPSRGFVPERCGLPRVAKSCLELRSAGQELRSRTSPAPHPSSMCRAFVYTPETFCFRGVGRRPPP